MTAPVASTSSALSTTFGVTYVGNACPTRTLRTVRPTSTLSPAPARLLGAATSIRSEEHTSELQSQSNLVCRLLLEKKKNLNAESCIVKIINNYPRSIF